MTKLAELLQKYDRYMQEEQKDSCPTETKRIISPEHQKELEEISAITPPKLGWRIFLILLCALYGIIMANQPSPYAPVFVFCVCTVPPAIALIVPYCAKRGVYNLRMERKVRLQRQIEEDEAYNNTLEQNQKAWEERKNRRDSQLRSIMSDVHKLIASKEYFEQLLHSDNAEEMEAEWAALCALLHMNRDISISDTYLMRSINLAQDITITDNSIAFRPTSSAWNMLEQASHNSRLARIMYYVSAWKVNEKLRFYCGEMMLDKSLVPQISLEEYLAQHDSVPSSARYENKVYKCIASVSFDYIGGSLKLIINRILQNQQLREQIVTNVKTKLPEPMWELVPSSERLLKMQGKWDRDNDEVATYLNQMNVELYDLSKSVHAGDDVYCSLLPWIKTATACSIPTGADIRNIAPHAFEKVRQLKCLSIPQNIRCINESIFSSRAIPDIIHIYYQGTRLEWNKIDLTKRWAYLPNGGYVVVHCTDTSFVA